MTLVIGYGSPLRTDDQLGHYLATRLEQYWDAIILTQLMPELAEPISRAQRVVFIDAAMGETPGEITCERVEPLQTPGAFTHNVTPASLLAAARELYGAAPEAFLIAVTGASFHYGCDFSPQIRAQLSQITSRVKAITTEFFSTQLEVET